MDEGRLTEKEIYDVLRTARTAAFVAIGISFIALCEIMFFSMLVLKGGVIK